MDEDVATAPTDDAAVVWWTLGLAVAVLALVATVAVVAWAGLVLGGLGAIVAPLAGLELDRPPTTVELATAFMRHPVVILVLVAEVTGIATLAAGLRRRIRTSRSAGP